MPRYLALDYLSDVLYQKQTKTAQLQMVFPSHVN